MGLRSPFSRRIATLQAFLELPTTRLLEFSRPPDLEVLVRRLIARLADDPRDPHAWVYRAPRFQGYREFFEDLVRTVDSAVSAAAVDLAELGVVMPHPPELDPDGEPWPWCRQVADHLSAVAEALPEEAGSLVLVLEVHPDDPRGPWGWCLGGLALAVTSDRAKIVAIDGGDGPLTPRSEDLVGLVDELAFAVPPAEMEAAVLAALDGGRLDPGESRRLRLLAGAFATSDGRFDEAERQLKEALAGTEADEAKGDRANALYNLGNLHARTGRYEEASEALAEAAEVALENDDSPLAAMALTNLGLSLEHERRGGEALESLGAARRLFKALKHRPGEAHVVDCTAGIWAPSDPGRARALWNEALALYDSIEAPHLREVRSGGRADVLEKLSRLPAAPGAG